MEKGSNRKIFISYSNNDRQQVEYIRHELLKRNFQVFSDFSDIQPGTSWEEEIKYRLESSDFVLILITRSLFERDGLKFDYTDEFFKNARKRNVNLIPVVLEKCTIPPYLLEFEIFDLTDNYEDNLGRLIDRIDDINKISFDSFSAKKFEDLIFDLLLALNFQNIWHDKDKAPYGIDFIGEYYATDPFGQKEKEVWIIETKFYKESRFDIQAIKKVIESYKYIQRKDAKLLLITNSQFNSAVLRYLETVKNSEFIDIKVIDGFQLKNIIAKESALLGKFFVS